MAGEYQAASVRGRAAENEWRELEQAFETVREVLLEHLVEAPVGRDALILRLHASLQNLDGVKQALLTTIRHGKEADAYLAARDAVAEQGLTRP